MHTAETPESRRRQATAGVRRVGCKRLLGHAEFHLLTAAYASSPAGDYNAPLLQQEPRWALERRLR